MRTTFWVSAFLVSLFAAASSGAADSVNLPSGGTLHYSASGGKTRLEIRSANKLRHVLNVGRDETVPKASAPGNVTVVAEMKGRAIIIIDSYASLPGGMSYCQSGQERFLRVISICRKSAVETFMVKLESCRENIELESGGVNWQQGAGRLYIRWLQGPNSKQSPEELAITIGVDGKPR